MSHGTLPWEPRPPLLVIHPGPVAKVFVEGCEIAAIPMNETTALSIAAQLLTAVAVRMSRTPTENLPFRVHEANRRADGVTIHADSETYHPQFDGDYP